MANDVRRPGLVTVVGVLVVISGVLDLALGLVWLFHEPSGDAEATVGPWIGAAFLAIGVVELLVARGLFRGWNRARIILTVVVLLDIAVSVVALTAGNNPRALSAGDLLFAVLVIVLLFTPKANAYFGPRPK